MDGCWHSLKENRWKVAGVAVVVAAVLAAGAAAQHQLSNTSLAISLPLAQLAAAAASRRVNSLAQVSQGTEGVLTHQQQEAPLSAASNEEFRLSPVKLTQEFSAVVPDETSEDPDTLTLEADDPFFIVVDDASVIEPSGSGADTSPAGNQGPQADITLPDDHTEAPSLGTELEGTVIQHDAQDLQTIQPTSNTVGDLNQNSSPPNDIKIIEQSDVSVNREAESNNAVIGVDEEESFLQSLSEDSVSQGEQFSNTALEDVIPTLEDVIPKSTSVITPSFEGLLEEPTSLPPKTDEALPTETLVMQLFTGLIEEDLSPTGPTSADFQILPEISSDPSPSFVSSKISSEKPAPDSVLAEVSPSNPSPAPVPVKIFLDDSTLASIPAEIFTEEETPDQIQTEVPEATVPAGARDSHDMQAPDATLDTGVADVGLQEIIDTDDSSGDHAPFEPSSEFQSQGAGPKVETKGISHLDQATFDAIQGTEAALQTQSTPPGNEERLITKPTKAASTTAAAAVAPGISEPRFRKNRLNEDTVLLVEGLPDGKGNAPEDTDDPFAPQIENFNSDPPINTQELSVVPELIADDPVSGVTFDHSEVIQDPALPMDEIELFFVAEDPQADEQVKDVQGVSVTEVKQQLLEDEVHIAALADAKPFSPGEVHLSPEMEQAVRDILKAQIASMDGFGLKITDETETASHTPPPAPPAVSSAPHPAPAPRPDRLPEPITRPTLAPTPAPRPSTNQAPVKIQELPAPRPSTNPAPVKIQELPAPRPSTNQAPVKLQELPAPRPSTNPAPVKIQKLPAPRPSTNPAPVKIQELPAPRPSTNPAPVKIQELPAPRPSTNPAPVKLQELPASVPKPTAAPEPAYFSPAPKPVVQAMPAPTQPPSTRPTYHPRPKPTQPTYRPQPKPTRPTYSPQPKPARPTYRPRPHPSRPHKPPTPATHPPAVAHHPARPPSSYVHVTEPKPEHFKPSSHHGPTHHRPTSFDDISPHVRPRPHHSPSYKPVPPPSYNHHPHSYKHRPSVYNHPSPHKAPPSVAHYEHPPTTTPKPHYRPPHVTRKPQKAQKPILAPLLIPLDLHSILLPKGVPSFTHNKPRPPNPFHLPFFFRSGRKQRLQVPQSVVRRLDSDQPEWVADLEPERR